MNGLDIAICVLLSLGALYGALRGFVIPCVNLASLGLGFVAAREITPQILRSLPMAKAGPGGRVLCFALVFLVTVLLCRVMGRRLKKAILRLRLGSVDRTAGAMTGFLVICLLLLFVVALEEVYFTTPPSALQDSLLFPLFRDVSRLFIVYVPHPDSPRHHEGPREAPHPGMDAPEEPKEPVLFPGSSSC